MNKQDKSKNKIFTRKKRSAGKMAKPHDSQRLAGSGVYSEDAKRDPMDVISWSVHNVAYLVYEELW